MGFKIGVISNSEGQVHRVVEFAGLTPVLDCLIDSHVVGVSKPDPKIFEIALNQVGVKGDKSWYVGDLYDVDVVGARRAGLTPVLYDVYNIHPEADCLRITRLKDILSLI